MEGGRGGSEEEKKEGALVRGRGQSPTPHHWLPLLSRFTVHLCKQFVHGKSKEFLH